MSVNFPNRHILEDRLAGLSAQPNAEHVFVIRNAAIFSVLARGGHESRAEMQLKTMPDVSLRYVGPGEWLVVSEARPAESLARDLGRLDPEHVANAEQSDGRVLLRICGPNVRAILAKCVAIDLHPTEFAQGKSASMLCCHVSANVARTAPDSFEILVPRSFAGYLFDELLEMGREFALSASFGP
jgi:heterotetrameric sarcosine oxidase gamma subunit